MLIRSALFSQTRTQKESTSPDPYRTMAIQGQLWTRTRIPHPSLPPYPQEQDPPKAVVTLPYIRHLSESIQRILNPLGIHTCFCPYQTLRRTHIPPQQWSGVVYRIPCGTCTKVYIGQTSRTLEHQLKEHRRALVLGEISLSAVAQHAVEEMHDIDWMGATVVDSHPHFHQRCALEAWHI